MTDMITLIRDIVIIIWGVLGILAFVVVILVALGIFRALKPILASAQATTANVQTISTLVTEVVAKPLIRIASFYSGMRQGLNVLGRIRRRRQRP